MLSGVPVAWSEGRVTIATAAHGRQSDGSFPAAATCGSLSASDPQILWIDEPHDLTLVSYRTDECPTISIRTTPLVEGEHVYLVGFPHGCPDVQCFIGLHLQDNRFSGIVAPGMSGGAILDSNGQLVGILTSYWARQTMQRDWVLWGSVGWFSPASLLPLQ